MSTKSSILQWVVGALLTMIVASGCMTTGGSCYKSPDGRFEITYYDLDPSAGATGINLDNYSYKWTLVTADNTRYEETGYYITHAPDEEAKPADNFGWHHPVAHKKGIRSSASVGETTEDYGSYTCITHPPGGGYIEYGSRTMITHPPGGGSLPNAK